MSGVDLKALYHQNFTIQRIQFVGTVHCAPCVAMNTAIGPGAYDALRSRGGLRAQVVSSGLLTSGPSELVTEIIFDPKSAGTQTVRPQLP